MCLLDFIEQQHAVGSAADGFGQLTAFLVTDVSRRRAEETTHCVLFAIFGHVDAYERVLVVEHEPGEGFGEFRLADARRTDEDERADRTRRILQTGSCAADRIRDGVNRLLLPDDAFVQARLHVQEFLGFGLEHLCDRDARPLMHDRGNVVHIHHLIQLMFGFPFIALLVKFLFESHAFRFLPRREFIIAVQASLFLLGLQLFDLGAHRLEVGRHGVQSDAQFRGGFVHQVNGFIRQSSICDVAVSQSRRGDQRLICKADFVVRFVSVAQTLQHLDRVVHAWLFHVDGSETPFERGVLFDVLVIFIQRRRADAL